MRWWAGKVRQFSRHVLGRVARREHEQLRAWLAPAQLDLFASMHPADQRHGLDVVHSLRAAGQADPDLLLAGLFHDAGKGREVGLWHRVAWSLGEHYGKGVRDAATRLPGFRRAFRSIERHPERSAELALAAGCSAVTAELIRHQAAPRDETLGAALLLADAGD